MEEEVMSEKRPIISTGGRGPAAGGARRTLPMPARYAINAVVVLVLLVLGELMIDGGAINRYQSTVLEQVGIYIILAVSLNIATGYLGQLPLGHAGFMSMGAYGCSIFIIRMSEFLGVGARDFVTGTPLALVVVIAGLVVGGLCAAIAGVIIGIPALRLKGDYLAIITLGFGEIIRVVLLNIDSVLGFKLTNGAAGLQGIPKTTTFVNAWLMVGLTCFLIHTFMKSRHGRAVLSIRENEIAAESCGINITYYKTLAFSLSAAFAGAAGALYAGYLGILNPSNFGFMKSIEILVMVVLGGMGSMAGSVVAAIVLTAAPEALRAFDDYRMIVYSLLLIVTMIFKPSGLLGRYDFSMKRIIEKCVNGELFASFRRGRGKGAEEA